MAFHPYYAGPDPAGEECRVTLSGYTPSPRPDLAGEGVESPTQGTLLWTRPSCGRGRIT